MEIPEIFYYNEDVAAVAFGVIMINIFLLVFLTMDFKRMRRMVFGIIGWEITIISSVIVWEKHGIIYFILIFAVWGFITYPKIWNKIENTIGFKL